MSRGDRSGRVGHSHRSRRSHLAWTGTGALLALAWLAAMAAGNVAAAQTSGTMKPVPGPVLNPTLGTAPQVEVVLNPRRATVGDRVEALLTVAVPAGAGEPRFPTWQKGWGAAEVLQADEPVRVALPGQEGRTLYRQRLVLAAFAPGQVALPPAAVAVPLAEQTLQALTPAGLVLDVASVLPVGDQKLDPKPAAALRPLPWGRRFWATAGVMSAALLAASLLLWRRNRPATAMAAAAAQPPLAELLARLDYLEAMGPEAPAAAHTQLSLALRRYLGRRLSFRAPESTTSEIQRLLSRRVPSALARRAVDLLRACDLVKFGRQEAPSERVRELVAAARQIAAEVEAHLQPIPSPEGSAAAPGPPRREAR
ncbi:MAG TPA: hypothetical protein VEG34_17910 [Thermoanaerobaculia bacterium]|nr:hypothetical protein [Thermoanaerobaculia bacterium]